MFLGLRHDLLIELAFGCDGGGSVWESRSHGSLLLATVYVCTITCSKVWRRNLTPKHGETIREGIAVLQH